LSDRLDQIPLSEEIKQEMKENLQKPIDQKHRLICQGKNLLNYLSRTDMKVMLDYAKVGAKLEGA